ncbi:putative quinol monooxygenase [Lichenicola sp.]|uniref:putative quinol monooxygenase n=1 Tax=Lichenicola sp. TaxID=2804529 RepID=UPI003AFFA795
MADSVHVVAVVVARAGQADAIMKAIEAVVAATRGETGCLSYVPHRDVQDPDRFVFIEDWESQAALDAHNRTPHLQAFAVAIEPLVALPLQVLVLRPLG